MTINKETGWNFDHSYTRLPKPFYTSQNPTPVRAPELVILNEPLAKSLGLNVQALQDETGVEVFAGNQVPESSAPLAQAYAGHQFGHINMLGDGRAILLGEQITANGERVDIQLKGSGRTPYSRGGDGRATLGPMLREYIISEAMHALGIPTTRSLAVVSTGEPVLRETELPGAILTRVAASHLRVGTFQYAAGKGGDDNGEDLRALADYTIERHYSEVQKADNPYLSFLQEVIKRQALLIAQWQLVGFIHGVMNTDNMTINGETIDYGPCAFMNEYDPTTVFSSIDTQGRYAYGNQPAIGGWNLARFAETLIPLLHDNEEEAVKLAQAAISDYPEQYRRNFLTGMRAKLGLFHEAPEDEAMIENLLNMMKKYHADFTNTFRALTYDQKESAELFQSEEFTQWHQQWQDRLSRQDESEDASRQLMRSNNPVVIPRNHKVEEALEAAVNDGDYHVMEKLLKVLASPYDPSPDKDEYCTLPAPSAKPYQTFCGT